MVVEVGALFKTMSIYLIQDLTKINLRFCRAYKMATIRLSEKSISILMGS